MQCIAEMLRDVPMLAEVVAAGARAIVAARYDRDIGRVTCSGRNTGSAAGRRPIVCPN
jgi:hypothetical protein